MCHAMRGERKLLNRDFDPYDALRELGDNQVVLSQEQRRLGNAFANMIAKIEHQQKLIDTIMASVDKTNQANEALIRHITEGGFYGKASDNKENG